MLEALVWPVTVDLSLRLGRVRLAVALVALAVAGTLGCPGGGAGSGMTTAPLLTTDDPDAEADLRAAREAADAGESARAETLYENFLTEHPSDPLVPIAELGLGQSRLAAGDTARALELFARVETSHDASVSDRGRFYRGVALHLAGQHAEARALLTPFVGRTVDPAETSLLFRTLAAAASAAGDHVAALEALEGLVREASADERAEAATRIGDIVQREASPAEIATAYDSLDHSGAAWPEVARRALREAYAASDMPRVRAIAAALRSAEVPLGPDLEELALRAARPDEADPRVIGAILPLSGRGREVGELAMRGLMVAAGMPPRGPLPPGAPQLVFRDDGGDPARAARAVDDLVSLQRAVAIVGPIDAACAAAAAERARQLGVPIITLGPSDPTGGGAGVFRLYPSAADEAGALVARAAERGARRFAVLHPDTPYGAAMRDAFATAVRARGAEVVTTRSYPATANAFASEIAEVRSHPVDAVFVADAAPRLSLIAPALASAGLWSTVAGGAAPGRGTSIVLLAPSVAFDPQTLRASSRYLQGAVISVTFDPATAESVGRELVDRYRAQFGSAPSGFSAYAYDAYRMVRATVDAGARTRAAVIAQLASGPQLETAGASGGLSRSRGPRRGARVLELAGSLWLPAGTTPGPAAPPR